MNDILTDYGIVDRSVIVDFANRCKIAFPNSYIELLAKHNGLQFKARYFEYFDLQGKISSASFGFCGYGTEVGEPIEIFQEFDIYGYDYIVVIGLRANGDYICFDYRENNKTDNPPVILMYHDQYIEDESGQPKMAIVKVAENFDAFLNMLHD